MVFGYRNSLNQVEDIPEPFRGGQVNAPVRPEKNRDLLFMLLVMLVFFES